MNDKELYQQKMQAQLDEWKAEVDKLRAKASGASADAQLQLNKQIGVLGSKIDEGQAKLAELRNTSADAWDSIKGGVDSAWVSMKSAFSDAAAKVRN